MSELETLKAQQRASEDARLARKIEIEQEAARKEWDAWILVMERQGRPELEIREARDERDWKVEHTELWQTLTVQIARAQEDQQHQQAVELRAQLDGLRPPKSPPSEPTGSRYPPYAW